ncbi:MAG TPA: L,D-transpeptidase family protein [Solirubrobacteraceae bacterium]|nr:L,D-transpeptidase family protein [Solirubrobacteraceae bacterium]
MLPLRILLPILTASAVLSAVAPAAEARTLSAGDRGADVRALNERLSGLGYLPAGAASSAYGRATSYAVMAFQKWHGLARDGIAGPQTKARLRSATRPAARTSGAGRRIEVLYERQVALLIRGGRVRRTISVSTGADGYRTPPGSFKVFRKERRSWSVPYKVWLPWASYFTGGVAFHAWRDVPAHPASHGCVRVPEPFAREVYRFASMNTRVHVIYPDTEIGGDENPIGPYGP